MKKLLLILSLFLAPILCHSSDVIIYDEGASPEKVLQYLFSVNTPDYDQRTDVLINPVVQATETFKYWKHEGGFVVNMSTTEIAAQDAAEAAEFVSSARMFAVDEASDTAGVGIRLRALIELLNKRDNFNTNRIIELQDRVQAMLDSTGGVANMRTDGLAVSISDTNTRSKSEAIQDYKDDINAGNQDNP